MMKVYVSGPMTGLPDFNREAFRAAAERLRAYGFEAVVPMDNGVPDPDHAPYHEHLRADLRLLLDCDAIALLPGWEASNGATLEAHVARALQFPEVIL